MEGTSGNFMELFSYLLLCANCMPYTSVVALHKITVLIMVTIYEVVVCSTISQRRILKSLDNLTRAKFEVLKPDITSCFIIYMLKMVYENFSHYLGH